MRTTYVKKARISPGTCQKCGKVIPAGAGYKAIKPRYGSKSIRCETCPDWRESERTGSDKLSKLYAAKESLEDTLGAWDRDSGEVSDLTSALEEAASTANEVAEEYREAASAWNDAGPAEGWNEKADQCESWASELEGAQNDIEDFDEDAAEEEATEESEADDVDEEISAATPPPDPEIEARLQTVPENLRDEMRQQLLAERKEQGVKTAPVDPEIEEKVAEKRGEWADEVESKVQDAIDSLEV